MSYPEISKDWLHRRGFTTKIFFLQNFVFGMEYSLTFVTLYIYLKDVLKSQHVDFFYSLISGSYLGFIAIAGLIMSKLFDNTRRTRLLFIIGNILTCFGNILYTIPYSPWLLFAGRTISGLSGYISPILTSEIARSYPRDEVLGKLSTLCFSFSLGLIGGPCINFAFIRADFRLFGVHIGYANGSGLALTIIYFSMMILSFFVSDLSREFDLKEATRNYHQHNKSLEIEKATEVDSFEKTDEALKESDVQTSILPTKLEPDQEEPLLNTIETIKQLLTNIDAMILLMIAFFFSYSIVTFESWIPMTCVNFLHWNLAEINAIVLATGAVCSISLSGFAVINVSHFAFHLLAVCSCISLAFVYVMFLYFHWYGGLIFAVDITIWICYTFCFSLLAIGFEMFTSITLALMVPSRVQTSAESIRLAFSSGGASIGMFTAAFLFHVLSYFNPICIVLCFVLSSMLVWRRKFFQNPKEILH
ncbi:uncharacterized protein [Clytia hemisphaerica]|uniref:Major facilitator superfamily (MFS) profile domain-containing protein n=1 Tax=Clytia hemisphaerica TaxID=252671 RepID=A0A7M5X4N8_9CNID|eukprot:TCONS_00024505-protein